MARLIAAITVALLIMACGHPYKQFGKTQAQADRDYLECEYEVEKAISGWHNPIQAGIEEGLLIRKCMRLRGY